jgi:lysophospholipase L1-like esterase
MKRGSGWVFICLMTGVLAAVTARAELVLTNYTAAQPLKMLECGDSITDDSVVNGAWRVYLEKLLDTNGYAFTNLGRWASTSFKGFTQVHHEGMDGAVIGAPGVSGPTHGYPLASNYALLTVADALTNAAPDLVLIDLGVNDMGHGRAPYSTATNDLSALLDLIFTHLPAAHIIISKPTTISYSTLLSPPYYTYRTNMFIFCDAVQALAAARRAQGQNVFVADLFSAVNNPNLLNSDGTHPNATGLMAIANEMMFRIAAITTRPDSVMTPFILGGSVWKYSDQGSDLGTNWSQPNFDDSTWFQGAGRLGYNTIGITTTVGYGGNAASKYITTYFRQQFVVPNDVNYTNLSVRLNAEDGAVVWLNGQELFRVNLPAGSITNHTLATTLVNDKVDISNYYYPTNRPIGLLTAGTNVVAVEIHKYSASADGLSFDLELFGQGVYPPPPTLAYTSTSAGLLLAWPTNSAGFSLQTATTLSTTGAWQTVSGPYPLSNDSFAVSIPLNASSAQFFRLIKSGP